MPVSSTGDVSGTQADPATAKKKRAPEGPREDSKFEGII
jgi:hypothetical protein